MAEVYTLQDHIDHTGGWEWEDKHVSQAYISDTGISQNDSISINDIIESGSVLIAAGPADLTNATKTADVGIRLVPIGLVETAQISMNKPLSRIFEIGSKLSYIIPGRAVGGISLSRVFFDGPSILKAIYMGEVEEDVSTSEKKYAKFASSPFLKGGQPKSWQEFAHISSGNLAMNLASSFFEQPVGLAFYFKDQQSELVGQTYFEGCRVSTYNLGISANMNVLTEAINMEFVRCRPIVTHASNEDASNRLVDRNIASPTTTSPADAVAAAQG